MIAHKKRKDADCGIAKCLICTKEFNRKMLKSYLCGSRECFLKNRSRQYKQHIKKFAKELTCKNCNVTYERCCTIIDRPFCTYRCANKWRYEHGGSDAWINSKKNHRKNSAGQLKLLSLVQEKFPNFDFESGEKITTQHACYTPDIISHNKNVIIEYYGDFWHCAFHKYKANYVHDVMKMTAQQIWDRDNARADTLTQLGYKIIIVWEHEFKKSKSEVIEKLRGALNV